ncbi:MAG TPA: type II toxin-antitoxin system HigB family toxin [Terracidiphilus sp.]|jgi:mRNA interferase HigB|nr:type II toxin-antitoxin system HigB family toxin [Terracidiphilus sp.]
MPGVYGIGSYDLKHSRGHRTRNHLRIVLKTGIHIAPIPGAEYTRQVRIIARGTLNGFVRNRVERRLRKFVKDHLDSWHAMVSRAAWKNSAELKAQFGAASIVSAERVVFNIKGNEFRLVAAVDYGHGIILILWLGTHREYDRIDVTKVRFDKERYANPSGSN